MDKIELLREKRQHIAEGGGPDKIERQHALGKMTARERIAVLLDEDSFVELNAFIEHRCTNFDMMNSEAPSDGVVTGYGTIDGRLVFVYSQDFTVFGGSLSEMHAKKICKIQDMALAAGAPVIGLNDSGGARIQEAVDALAGYGDIFFRNTKASGVIPQIVAIMGPCAGGAVYSPALMDFIFMTDDTAHMFITGPDVIRAVTGEVTDSDSLGGARAHNAVSGVAHFEYPDEYETLAGIRRLLSFLPLNNREGAPVYVPNDVPDRISESLNSIIPERASAAFDVKQVIAEVVDDGDFFEVHEQYAKNMVVGFARINGRSVGILANQPKCMAGCLDINASDKASRFISICDSFNIPLVTFVDVPGYLPGVAQEHGGIIRHGAKLLFAYSEATVPKVTVILRKAYGGAYIAMCSKHLGGDIVLAWPTAEIAVMGAQGAANIIFRKEIEASEDPAETRQRKIDEYTAEFATPYYAAKRGYVDDVIEPAYTRQYIASALEMLASKKERNPKKKHGNFPV